MNSKLPLLPLTVLLASNLVPYVAYSEVYLTEDQVLKAIFPQDKFIKSNIKLTPTEIDTIEKTSGEAVRNKTITVWKSAFQNTVYIDQVLGKHEFITYAVGISTTGKIAGIEIMEYRETFGQQVRNAEWRKQFLGKDVSAPLKLKKDIVNISGATLSSSHVTAGVRRILRTHEVLQGRYGQSHS